MRTIVLLVGKTLWELPRPVPIIIVVLPGGSSRAERLYDRPSFVFDTTRLTGLDERFEVRPLAPLVQVANVSRRIPRQSVLVRRPDFPPTFSATALGVSTAIDCKHVDARGRELRNASGPEEKKTLKRQIKEQDDLINRYKADLTKRGEY